ncbi:MAG: HAMP domain-containing histidine kinase, partial [Bacteroidales bacterium]|nr:HAMP domain-containing histidine kinase [Bacteroidales bacterium]
ADNSEDITFYSSIISKNTTIPVILTEPNGEIISVNNVSFDPDTVHRLTDKLQEEFTKYPPIAFDYNSGNINFFYYKDSRVFTQLRELLNDHIQSFFTDVINSASVPVIITDSAREDVVAYGNIDSTNVNDSVYINQTLDEMAYENDPIKIDLADQGPRFIYYKDSFLLKQLRYYPYIMFAVIGVFLIIAYLLFSVARKSEQNQVWVGMAKETAHQLGTPLSSMYGWLELLKMRNGLDQNTLKEIEKDLGRLQTITERFSKIGSEANLLHENILEVIRESIHYAKARTSRKVKFEINHPKDRIIRAPLNRYLFEWVIENLCKNAADAIEGEGKVSVNIFEDEKDKHVIIDVNDTGKGLQKSQFKNIFKPGVTSKKRGWGLGLSLSKRIIENYHNGRIYVKASVPGKGTTFRIVLKKHKDLGEKLEENLVNKEQA